MGCIQPLSADFKTSTVFCFLCYPGAQKVIANPVLVSGCGQVDPLPVDATRVEKEALSLQVFRLD